MPGAVRAIIAVLAGTILDLDGLARAQHVQGLDRPLDVNRHVLPMRQKIIIRTIDEIVPLITEVRAAAQRTAHALAELTTVELDGVEIPAWRSISENSFGGKRRVRCRDSAFRALGNRPPSPEFLFAMCLLAR